MKWKDILSEKGNQRLLLGSIIIIVVIIVMIRQTNKNHLSELQESVSSIYVDRLVAKDYIFELSKKVYSKKIMVEYGDEFLEKSIHINDSIQQLVGSYENTELTEEEGQLLVTLKNNIRISEKIENKFLQNPAPSQQEIIIDELTNMYDLILVDLGKLSAIQLSEGRKLLNNSYQIIASSNNTNYLEIALTIVLLLIIIKIFSGKKEQAEK